MDRIARTWLDRLALPMPVVAALLVVGGVLADVHPRLVQQLRVSGQPEWPQWVGRLTVQQYWLLIPLAMIALWARRRSAQGLLGAVGAALCALPVVAHLVVLAGSLVWDALLGRGDLPAAVMVVEYPQFVGAYLGVLATGVALLVDRQVARPVGILVIGGLVVDFAIPFGIAICYGVLAGYLLVHGLLRRRAVAVAAPVAG